MGSITSLLTLPLMESQGQVLTLLDILITIVVFLAFYVLARITSRQVQNRVLRIARVSGSALDKSIRTNMLVIY